MPELYLTDALGGNGKPVLRVHTAGSVGGSTAVVAANYVQSGAFRRVLTVSFEKQSESNATWALSPRMAERRARMRDVGARMFARLGIAGVAILDIAREAHVPVSAAAHGYRRRQDLVFDILYAYIDALPPQKTSKLKKRKDVVVEALYKKPAAYQGKTRQSRPFDPSQMISVKIPRTMRDVLNSPLSAHWLAAKDKECDSFKEKQHYWGCQNGTFWLPVHVGDHPF